MTVARIARWIMVSRGLREPGALATLSACTTVNVARRTLARDTRGCCNSCGCSSTFALGAFEGVLVSPSPVPLAELRRAVRELLPCWRRERKTA